MVEVTPQMVHSLTQNSAIGAPSHREDVKFPVIASENFGLRFKQRRSSQADFFLAHEAVSRFARNAASTAFHELWR